MERKKISGCHKLREGGWLLIVGGFFLACWKCSKNCGGGWVTLNILKTMNELYLLNGWIVWYVKPFKGKASWCFPCKSELVQQVREADSGSWKRKILFKCGLWISFHFSDYPIPVPGKMRGFHERQTKVKAKPTVEVSWYMLFLTALPSWWEKQLAWFRSEASTVFHPGLLLWVALLQRSSKTPDLTGQMRRPLEKWGDRPEIIKLLRGFRAEIECPVECVCFSALAWSQVWLKIWG